MYDDYSMAGAEYIFDEDPSFEVPEEEEEVGF